MSSSSDCGAFRDPRAAYEAVFGPLSVCSYDIVRMRADRIDYAAIKMHEHVCIDLALWHRAVGIAHGMPSTDYTKLYQSFDFARSERHRATDSAWPVIPFHNARAFLAEIKDGLLNLEHGHVLPDVATLSDERIASMELHTAFVFDRAHLEVTPFNVSALIKQ